MAGRLSLAQQLAQLEQPAPIDHDPEDNENTEDQDQIDLSAGRGHYIDVGPSSLRKLQDSVSDPKYDGVRVSRQQIQADEGEDEPPSESDDPQSSDETESVRSQAPTAAKKSTEPPTRLQESDLSITLQKRREVEREKGKAVSRQIVIYDNLLDARIRLQKCVAASNLLPTPSDLHLYLLSEEARQAANNLLKEAAALTDEILDLRQKLLLSTDLVTPPPNKRRKFDKDNEDIDWEEQLQADALSAAELESSLHPFTISTLQKWSNKVLAIAPSALLPSNHTKFTRTSNSQLKGAVQLIEESLADREKLIKRTRTRRGNSERIGSLTPPDGGDEATANANANADQLEDPESFDDTDFYQQLLRDIVDLRSGNSELTAEYWKDEQRNKKSKKKQQQDKSSKDRRLKFTVHEKLQNFMVPVKQGTPWHEEQIDELFASLLGKSMTQLPASMDVDSQPQPEPAPVLTEGFRLFG